MWLTKFADLKDDTSYLVNKPYKRDGVVIHNLQGTFSGKQIRDFYGEGEVIFLASPPIPDDFTLREYKYPPC